MGRFSCLRYGSGARRRHGVVSSHSCDGFLVCVRYAFSLEFKKNIRPTEVIGNGDVCLNSHSLSMYVCAEQIFFAILSRC